MDPWHDLAVEAVHVRRSMAFACEDVAEEYINDRLITDSEGADFGSSDSFGDRPLSSMSHMIFIVWSVAL